MRVVAITASRERACGPASLLLDPFLDGLREAGAEVDRCYTRDLLIDPRGRSLIGFVHMPCNRKARYGMRRLRRRIGWADMLVLASPLYCDGRTGPENATPALRQLLEGLVPGSQMPAGSHEPVALREEEGHGKVVIASGSGFWEIDAPCRVSGHSGTLRMTAFHRPGEDAERPGVLLRCAMPLGLIDWDVIGAARGAGYSLVLEDIDPALAHDLARSEAVTRDFYDRIKDRDISAKLASYPIPSREKCVQKED